MSIFLFVYQVARYKQTKYGLIKRGGGQQESSIGWNVKEIDFHNFCIYGRVVLVYNIANIFGENDILVTASLYRITLETTKI